MFDLIFEWFQRRCPHDPSFVTADILEGDAAGAQEVHWCQRCGAYYRSWGDDKSSAWREPRATWAR